MNKAHFFLLLTAVFLLSCKNKRDTSKEKTTGEINTISVLIDDQLWKGEIGDSVRNKFASSVIGLPQEEPQFTINQYPIKFLEGFVVNSRNSIIIKKEAVSRFEIKKNEFASPQNVFYISGRNTIEIINTIEKHVPEIIRIMRQTEIVETQRINDTALIKTDRIKKKFKIALNIPKGYNSVLTRKKFIWFKKEIIGGSTSVLIYQIPINNIKNHFNSGVIKNIIKMRDSIGSLYIHGTERNSKMITEQAYSPYFFHTKLDGRITYETKGTWEMKNDFMSGPFINYCITDYKNRRMLVLEGFCYAPSKKKRDLMFELEAIIKSVKYIKNK
ncbi:MAG: DUF4837 family protein [Chitinophagaceae bacterium]|nr:DUF4837 family protein [Chitinophagaceae bacterium]